MIHNLRCYLRENDRRVLYTGISGYQRELFKTDLTHSKSNDKNINLFFGISALEFAVVFSNLIFQQVGGSVLYQPFLLPALWSCFSFFNWGWFYFYVRWPCTLSLMTLSPDLINWEPKWHPEDMFETLAPEACLWIRPRFLQLSLPSIGSRVSVENSSVLGLYSLYTMWMEAHVAG